MACTSSSRRTRSFYRRLWSSLQEDILIQIFTYLPLNSIYKLRCISKVWRSILSDPNFITKWFQVNRKSLPWIHYHQILCYNSSRFKYAYPELHSEFMSTNQHLFSFNFLINELPCKVTGLSPSSSSNGLVLCHSHSSDGQSRSHVCNPLTRKWVSLPTPPHFQDRGFMGIFSECYSSSSASNCYKVVHIPVIYKPSKKFNVDIFSSDLGVWGSFQVSCDENVARNWDNVNNIIILNGVLFWIEGEHRLLIYKLNQENKSDGHRCCLIDLPDIDMDVFYGILGESEGCVCFARTRVTGMEVTVSVWVLNEFNWHILHNDISINLPKDIEVEDEELFCGDEYVRLLGFSPVDRNVVLLGCKHWVRGFNIQTRRFEELRLDRLGRRGSMRHVPFVLNPMPTVLPAPTWIDT